MTNADKLGSTILGIMNDVLDCTDLLRNNDKTVEDVLYVYHIACAMMQRLQLIRKEAYIAQKVINPEMENILSEIIDLVDGTSSQLEYFIDDDGYSHPHSQEHIDTVRRFKPY